jgi:hypothetical protein
LHAVGLSLGSQQFAQKPKAAALENRFSTRSYVDGRGMTTLVCRLTLHSCVPCRREHTGPDFGIGWTLR